MTSSPLENSLQTVLQRQRDMEVGWEDASGLVDLLKQMRHTTEFEPRIIPREWIGQILAAGRWSSSLYNNQPWYFIVVADRQAHKELQDAVWTARQKLKRWRPLWGLFRKALRDPQLIESLKNVKLPGQVIFDHTVVILACMDRTKPEAAASCAMALNNMALEATRLGMGCAFTSATQSLNLLRSFRQDMGLDSRYRFFVSLMVGFGRRGSQVHKQPRKEVTEISHWI